MPEGVTTSWPMLAAVYAWGALVDRIGERAVLAIGPALGGLALASVVLADSYGVLLSVA